MKCKTCGAEASIRNGKKNGQTIEHRFVCINGHIMKIKAVVKIKAKGAVA